MKKKLPLLLILLAAAILAAAAGAIFSFCKPYQPVSFVADGENWSAAVENGSELILNLKNEDASEEWSIASSPDCFSSDYSNLTEAGAEFHIIALDEGEGEMIFNRTKDDGSTEEYILTFSISRHQKTFLQIDSVAFGK